MTDPRFDDVLKDDENQPVDETPDPVVVDETSSVDDSNDSVVEEETPVVEGQKSGSFDPSATGAAFRPGDLTDETDEDRGNHEHLVRDEPPHVNDEGELVDKDGNKVFTTVEETIKDGSMVLDEKGRQPGVYLDDIEEEERQQMRERYEEAYKKANARENSVVERQVNVNMSPIPPVTVPVRQEAPVANNEESVDTHPDVNVKDDRVSTATE